MLNYSDKIKEIIDVTKTRLFLVLKDLYFPKFPSYLDDATKEKLAILGINAVFLEETPLCANDIRETSPALAEGEVETIKTFILRECSSFLDDAIRLKAFCISKLISPDDARVYLLAAKEIFPSLGDIPTDIEADVLIDAWDKFKEGILAEKYEVSDKTKCITFEDFEATIKRHENQLFGISLYNEGIKHLYGHDKDVLDTTNYHFREIMSRGQKAISQAKELLEKVKSRTEDIKALNKFEFPPIHGPGLDEMTQRATLLVEVYEKLFPYRPRNIPLTTEENKKLMREVSKTI